MARGMFITDRSLLPGKTQLALALPPPPGEEHAVRGCQVRGGEFKVMGGEFKVWGGEFKVRG